MHIWLKNNLNQIILILFMYILFYKLLYCFTDYKQKKKKKAFFMVCGSRRRRRMWRRNVVVATTLQRKQPKKNHPHHLREKNNLHLMTQNHKHPWRVIMMWIRFVSMGSYYDINQICVCIFHGGNDLVAEKFWRRTRPARLA